MRDNPMLRWTIGPHFVIRTCTLSSVPFQHQFIRTQLVNRVILYELNSLNSLYEGQKGISQKAILKYD